MEVKNKRVFNFEGAIRGMRNPKKSWDKSDSFFGVIDINHDEHDKEIAEKWVESTYSIEGCETAEDYQRWLLSNGLLEVDIDHQHALVAFLGPNDFRLMKTLISAGSEHRKFLRQIGVSMDITAPLYLWKEIDTYKVGTTTDSESTMHKIANEKITLSNFETDDYSDDMILFSDDKFNNEQEKEVYESEPIQIAYFESCIIETLEWLRVQYLNTKDVKYWKELIRWLPESWLQTRTYTCSYETLYAQKAQRTGHKLTEWKTLLEEESKLPYVKDLFE